MLRLCHDARIADDLLPARSVSDGHISSLAEIPPDPHTLGIRGKKQRRKRIREIQIGDLFAAYAEAFNCVNPMVNVRCQQTSICIFECFNMIPLFAETVMVASVSVQPK